MKEVHFTPAAMHDLTDIYEYIARDNEIAAVSTLDGLFRHAEILSESPHLGRNRDEDLRQGVRSLPVGNYTLFYRVLDETVEVLRVLHGSRDLPPLFE
jgi:toxin ParE1/3/4